MSHGEEGGDTLTFRDAFSSESPPPQQQQSGRYAGYGQQESDNDDDGDFEPDSEEEDRDQQRPLATGQKGGNAATTAAAGRPTLTAVSAKTGGPIAGQAARPVASFLNAADAAIEAALATGLWKRTPDPNTGKSYFYNVVTRETTWDLAAKLGVKETTPVAMSSPKFNPAESLGSFAGMDKVPRLKLETSVAADSDAAPTLQLPPHMGLSGRSGSDAAPFAATPLDGALGGAAATSGNAGRPAGRHASVATSDDDVEDEAVSRAKLLARGGRIPIASAFARTGGPPDLYNEVSAFKAFASESDQASSAAGDGLPAAALPAAAKATVAAADPPTRRAPVPASDSSDFSTASQAIKKPAAVNAAAALPSTAAVVTALPNAVAEATPRGVVAATATAATADGGAVAAKEWRPLSDRPYQPPPPAYAVAAAGGGGSALPTSNHVLATNLDARDPTPVISRPAAAGLGFTSDHINAAQAMAPHSGGGGPSASFRDQGAALDHLVRAYTQLRGAQAATPSSAAHRDAVDDRLADAIHRALMRADDDSAADDHDGRAFDSLDDGEDRIYSSGAAYRRAPLSSKARLGPLVQHQHTNTKYASWGRATSSAASATMKPRGSRRLHYGHDADGGGGAEEAALDGRILDVVLAMFIEKGGSASAAPSYVQRVDRERPTRVAADERVLLASATAPTSQFVSTSAGGSAFSASMAPEAFREPGSVRSCVTVAFAKYVTPLVARWKRERGPTTATRLTGFTRAVMADLSLALQTTVSDSLGCSQRLRMDLALPPSYATLHVTLAPQGDEQSTAAQRRLVFNIMNCMPMELLAEDTASSGAAANSGGSFTCRFRFEFWVTLAHIFEIVSVLTSESRGLELTAQDWYTDFTIGTSGMTTDDGAAIITPDRPIFKVHLNAAALPACDAAEAVAGQVTRPATGLPSAVSTSFAEDEAAEQILFAAAKIVDQVAVQAKTSGLSAAATASALGRQAKLRSRAELAVAQTLEEFFADEQIRGAVTRRSVAVCSKAMADDPNAALLADTQAKVNRMVERMRYEMAIDSAQ